MINQHGTIHLTTALTSDDLSNGERTEDPLEFALTFPSQGEGGATLRFLSMDAKESFLRLPREYITKMADRDPMPEEFQVYRGSLTSFETRHTMATNKHRNSVTPVSPTPKAQSPCEISLYGRMPNEVYKTTRRLVISSSPDEPTPWCYSYWLPLSSVQVHVEDGSVELHWSDFQHLQHESRNFFDSYSFVYDADRPNFQLSFVFNPEYSDVREFVDVILKPFETSINFPNMRPEHPFGVLSSNKELRVWNVTDLHEKNPEKYLAIVSVEKKANNRFVTEIFFVHRDDCRHYSQLRSANSVL